MPKKFFANDFNTVVKYVWQNIIDPAFRQLIFNIITAGAGMTLFDNGGQMRGYISQPWGQNAWNNTQWGQNAWNNTQWGNSQYNSMFKGTQWGQGQQSSMFPQTQIPQKQKFLSYEAVPVESKNKAMDVINEMKRLISIQGAVSVSEMCDCAGLIGYYTINNYGWYDISNVQIKQGIDGYFLSFPAPVVIIKR